MAEADNPTVIARETLKILASRRMAPTPRNYQRIYAEIAGDSAADTSAGDRLAVLVRQMAGRSGDDSPARTLQNAMERNDLDAMAAALQSWMPRADKNGPGELGIALRELIRNLEHAHRGWTIARKREALERHLASNANDSQLAGRLTTLMRAWQEGGVAPGIEEEAAALEAADAGGPRDPIVEAARELLANALESGVAPRIERYSDVHSELFQLSWRVREAEGMDDWERVTQQLKQFWVKVEMRAEPDEELIQNLVRLIGLLVENIDELVEDEQWVQGQVAVLKELISKPIDLRAVRDAERGFKEVIYKQSQLKAGLSEAKSTLKSLLAVFIQRLGDVAGHTAEYHGKIERYVERIAATDSIDMLKRLVDELMADTRGMQIDMIRSRDDLLAARGQAESAEQRVRMLEAELERVSGQVREDQLTGTLNRRGMNEAMQREISRAERSGKPMCIAVLDLDNFKKLNDTYGHAAGDAALVHLAKVIRRTVRPTDVIARYGGEEFVIILADTDLDTAVAVTVRLQRELTKRFFLHNNERLLITFSAGVAQFVAGEEEATLFERADKAMYQAKVQGKNQVVRAE